MFGDKPLFSRIQLSMLMVAVTLAIALLSSLNGKPGIPEVHHSILAGVPVYWSEAHDSRPYALVNLALPESEAPMLVATVLQQLVTGLKPEVEARRYPDRWELLMPASPAAVTPLLADLSAPLSPARWQQLGERYRAQRYLEGALPGSALAESDSGFGARAAAFHRQLVSRAQLSLSFTGVAFDEGLPSLGLEGLPVGEPWPQARGSGFAPSRPMAGLERVLPGRGDDGFAAAALAVRLLQPLAEAEGVKWRFEPGNPSSRLQLTVSADGGATLARLDQALASLETAQIEVARRGLLHSLEAAMADPRGYARQQGVLAYYRLPLDYWSRFVATITALPAEDPVNRARNWLDRRPEIQRPDHDQKTETAHQRGT